MSKTIFNFWLDTLLMVLFLCLAAVSAITQFVFPPPANANGWLLWGATYGHWLSIQFGILCALGLGILLHVMMHWGWVCGVISTKFSRSKKRMDDGIQTIVGVGLLIVLLHIVGGFVFAAWVMIQKPEFESAQLQSRNAGLEITREQSYG
ncbi:hypothetical protein Pan258_59010 [Symmachiella dynata]|uniref:hypothetical protein n=1 Tax=Symmachiella dynata TaxID=2527995 RepID=UPI00118AAA18|nr:hypothetical protein [Symmachiella dynata]QDT51808.1 hypothetical protein Pan258_59010 [Symmachiella dynata]